MRIETRLLEDELYQSANEAGHEVLIDMRPATEKQHQSPVELLLSALAGCAAVDIVAILRKRRKNFHGLTIITDGHRNATPPRYFKTIHCTFTVYSTEVTTDELQKAAHLSLEKYCSVASSLKSEITFSVMVEPPTRE
ncbi:MAG: OsmC family protein [Bacteroidota bacterium]